MTSKKPNKSLELINRLGSMSKSKRKILDWLITVLPDCNRRDEYVWYQDIADCTGVPIGTTNRIMAELITSNLIYRDYGGMLYLSELLKLTR